MSLRNNTSRRMCAAAIVALLLTWVAGANAQQDRRAELAQMFDKREVMIPVRDGVKLHTEIYTPKDAKEPLPFLWSAHLTAFRLGTRG